MIKIQKRYFIGTLTDNETNSGHHHNAHMYSDRCHDNLYDESAFSRFEVTNLKLQWIPPYYSTKNQDIFIQDRKDFNFATTKPSKNLMTFT